MMAYFEDQEADDDDREEEEEVDVEFGEEHDVMGSAYRNAEDIALCNAYVSITQDGVVGSAQAGDTYWKRVVEQFILNSEGNPNNRSMKGLETRFGTIKKEVAKYVALLKYYLRHPQSGVSKAAMLLSVRSEFEGKHGHKFQFEHCYEILKSIPKFNPLYGVGDQSSTQPQPKDATGSNPSTPTSGTQRFTSFPVDVGPNLSTPRTVRPEGQKAAKRVRAGGISQSSFDTMCSKDAEFVELYKETQSKMSEGSLQMRTNMQSYVQHKELVRHDKLLEREERIMSIVTTGMPELQRRYWDQKQQEILRKHGLLD